MAYNYEYPYVDTSRANADWMLNQFKYFREELDRLSEEVAKFDITKAEVVQMIDEAVALCEAFTNSAINSYDVNRMRPYVMEVLNAFNNTIRNYINAQDEAYFIAQSNRTDAIASDLVQYIDNKVINVLDMTNPVTGETQTIPEVIDYIVETFHRENALTAAQYDGYELTANAYDSQLISAYAYDFDGINQVIH